MTLSVGELTPLIRAVCEDERLDFAARAERIRSALEPCSDAQLLEHLDHAGVIPECFEHDSTEEKLFAKYCDYLLAAGWRALGLSAKAITERTDAADVLGRLDNYSVVGDAKAFRLSRTAKNQKDFKVEALNQWRKGAEYACLVCPLYQYPSSKSQIYLQAGTYNVCLSSYTHLAFLVRHKPKKVSSLRTLWGVAQTIPKSQDARAYWQALDKVVLEISDAHHKEWSKAVEETKVVLAKQAAEQIEFWEGEKARVRKLTREEATKELIVALKIDSKIAVISKNLRELEESTEKIES